MPRLRKGSVAAKRYMARLRAMRRTSRSSVRRKRTYKRSPPRRRKIKRSYAMPRRRTVRRRTSSGANIKQVMIGAAAVPFIEPWINQIAGQFGGNILGMSGDDIIKVGLGWYLAKKKTGYLRGIGVSLAVLGVSRMMEQIAARGIGAIAGPSATQTATAGALF